MDTTLMQYPPGDPRMIDTIVNQLKSQGIFDQFRRECIADVDTKPAYQNLHQRVEGTVSGFLSHQVWRPDLNKNQLRESLRKHIHESGFLDMGVERIVDQVVNPKIMTVLVPQVEDVVYKFIGIEKPKKMHAYPPAPYQHYHSDGSDQRKEVNMTDLLPKDLDPVSPESDMTKKSNASVEDGEFDDKRIEDEESPPFEPIAEVNENSVGSHLSGISGLTSPDDQRSNISYNGGKTPPQPTTLGINNDSQLSKVSSGSQLSFNFGEAEKSTQPPVAEQYSPMNIDSNDSNSKSSFVGSSGEVVEKFESTHIHSDMSHSSDDQGKVTTTTEIADIDSDSESSSSSDSDDSDRPVPSPGLGSCDEGGNLVIDSNMSMVKNAVPILDCKAVNPMIVVDQKDENMKECKVEEKLMSVIEVKRERDEHKLPKHDREEKQLTLSKEEARLLKDVVKDDEKLIKKEKDLKKSIRSDKDESSIVKKHKEGDKLVQKEKKDVELDSVKKSEKGKDVKSQEKDRSVKREDKDKKSSKSQGSKEDSKVEKDKSSKRLEEKEKPVKKDEKELKSSKGEEKRKPEATKVQDSKRKEGSSHTSQRSDKDKLHISKSKRSDSGEKTTKADSGKHVTKEDKVRKDEKEDKTKRDEKSRIDDKQRSKNGKVEREKASKPDEKSCKDKDRKMKEKDTSVKGEPSKHDRERKDSKSKSSNTDKHKDSSKKKEKGKLIDDHDKHREKRSEDRRSTDRDSNGTTRDRSSSSSHTASTTAKDAQRHETKDGKKGSGKSSNGSNTEAMETVPKDDVAELPLSPTSASNKRPLVKQEGIDEEYFCTSNEGKLTLKIKKPKIAANIFEVQKIIKLRRSLAKLEMKRQQELSEAQELSEEVDRERLAKTEQSNPEDVEGFKYFETYDENKGWEFVEFIKRLGQSRTLSEIDVSSVATNDLEYLSDSELPDKERIPTSYALFPFPGVEYVPYTSGNIDRTIDAVSRGLSTESIVSPAVSEPIATHKHETTVDKAEPHDTACAQMKPPQISPSTLDKRETRRARKPNMKYSSDDYSFVTDDAEGEDVDMTSQANKRRRVCESPDPVDNNNKDESVECAAKVMRTIGARRVGLSRPKVAAVTQIVRVATPDFVMPLSPESDVSASSSELVKKPAVEQPSPSTSEEEVAANGVEENNRSHRRSTVPTLKSQRYSSDDLYKPRPLFNRATRRKRGSSPTSIKDASVNATVPSESCNTQPS